MMSIHEYGMRTLAAKTSFQRAWLFVVSLPLRFKLWYSRLYYARKDRKRRQTYVGIDWAIGPDTTVYSCPDCGMTSYPCNHLKGAWERNKLTHSAGEKHD